MLTSEFVTGRTPFTDVGTKAAEKSAKVYVPVNIGGIHLLAQIDTGAPWSVLPTEICDALGLLNGDGPVVPLSTRVGSKEGRLERITITFIASEGVSLDVSTTVFVSSDWDGDAFIGWGGCLERVRIAIDPGKDTNHFYFGAVA